MWAEAKPCNQSGWKYSVPWEWYDSSFFLVPRWIFFICLPSESVLIKLEFPCLLQEPDPLSWTSSSTTLMPLRLLPFRILIGDSVAFPRFGCLPKARIAFRDSTVFPRQLPSWSGLSFIVPLSRSLRLQSTWPSTSAIRSTQHQTGVSSEAGPGLCISPP
jgi:hypothetical protein